MPYRLRDDLHWCDCNGRTVFLDLAADRYFCLPAATDAEFQNLANGRRSDKPTEPLRPLVAHGLLVEAPGGKIRAPASIAAPCGDYPIGPNRWPDLLSVLRAIATEMRLTWRLRTRPFHGVVKDASQPWRTKSHATGILDGKMRQIVAAANATSFLTGVHDRCLVRALAVQSACRRSGIDVSLVFGVIAHPFAAHCWVQRADGTVLVGGFEQARLYTPILVLP